ncbi:MAG TPA: GGDEF domain-containing protein, partial [Firmicutes bacterium]|nr:GGDEF domain-containing protein [Bacillota bacterium]
NDYALGCAYTALTWDSIDRGKYKEGASFARLARKHYALAGDNQRSLQALNGEASALKALGKFDAALDRYLDGLEQAKEMGSTALINLFLSNLGGLMNALGQYDEALEYFSELFDLMGPDEKQDGSEYYMMGLSYHLKDCHEQAEPLFLKAAKLSKEQGKKYLHALCNYRLGQIEILRGHSAEGERLIRLVLATSREIGVPTLETRLLVELAKIEEGRGNHGQALQYAQEGIKIARANNAKESLLANLLVLAGAQKSVHDCEMAYESLKEVRALEQEQYSTNLLNSLKVAKARQVRRENMIYKDLYERINTISRIGQSITSTFELEEIGRIVWDNLKSLLPVDTLAVGVHNKEHNDLRYEIFIHEGQFLPKFTKRLDPGEPWLEEVEDDAAYFKLPGLILNHPEHTPAEANRSLLFAPLFGKKETVGTLVVQSKEPDAYHHYHRDILRALAAYVAIALENRRLFSHVRKLANVDALTGLYNRRFVLEMEKKEFAKAKRYQTGLCVIVVDVDNLKEVNDNHGHAAGDRLLQETAAVFANNIRASDTVGRLGGDEFLLILPNTEIPEAEGLAVRLRDSLAGTPFAADGDSITIRASFGVAEFNPEDGTIEDTILRADKSLYQSKALGGNLVIAK